MKFRARYHRSDGGSTSPESHKTFRLLGVVFSFLILVGFFRIYIVLRDQFVAFVCRVENEAQLVLLMVVKNGW